MAYGNKHITFKFDELDEGLFVTIKNPRLYLKATDLPSPEVDADGKVDVASATQAAYSALASLIVDWKMWDLAAEGDEVELAQPSLDPSVLNPDRCPPYVLTKVMSEVSRLVNPT